MNQRSRGLELHARAGRAVLVGHGTAPSAPIPDPMPSDSMPSDPNDLQLPTGLEKALHEWARVAEAVLRSGDHNGEPGTLVSHRGRLLAARLAISTGLPVGYADPMGGGMEVLPPGEDLEPTPWATGLSISAATAVLVGVALIALSEGLDSVGAWLVVVANLLVAAGLAPSIWLARATPTWRWVAYGAASGILLTWVALLLSLLGR